jgi:hypothetical protein
MLELVPDPLETYLSETDAAHERTTRDLYPLRLLEITRQVRAAVQRSTALLLDLSSRWDKPIGPTMTGVRTDDATHSAIDPPMWLAQWRSPQGDEWQIVRARAEHHLTYALGFGEPEDLGWTEERPGEWRVDLLDRVAVQALNTFQQVVFTPAPGEESRWAYLDYFVDGSGARFFARRDCPNCHGEGLIQAARPLPHGGDTDNCPCVRRLPA